MQAAPAIYIDSREDLAEFCRSLRGSHWIAVDTEFVRDKTYFPRFCLLQVANLKQAACIDPFAVDDLDPVMELLFTPEVTKVFHAARQDLEVFFHRFGAIPSPIFDTQIAAPLIGLPEQVSYANLISALLGIPLNKDHTRTDWARRPLSPAQIAYAANDVIYLAAAYHEIRERLDALGRTDWLAADFAALLDPALYTTAPEAAWQRISGAHRLQPEQFALLVELAAWRETAAQRDDLPRHWIVRDEGLLDLARHRPASAEALRSLRGIEPKTLNRYGSALLEVIQRAQGRKITPPCSPRPEHRTPETDALIDALSAVVRLRCNEHTINPGIVATRKDLEDALANLEDARILHGWRRSLVGNDILDLLQGKKRLRVAGGTLRIEAHE
jgi:ribonuclease D